MDVLILSRHGLSRTYLIGNRLYALGVYSTLNDPYNIPSGVPQGSNLGPLLFNIFINDLASIIYNSNCLLFADDCKLYKQIDTYEDSLELQNDLNRLCICWIENHLYLNSGKCKFMIYTKSSKPLNTYYQINCSPLELVQEFIDLGTTFSKELSFSKHIELTCLRAYRNLGFIIRNSHLFNNTSSSLSLTHWSDPNLSIYHLSETPKNFNIFVSLKVSKKSF